MRTCLLYLLTMALLVGVLALAIHFLPRTETGMYLMYLLGGASGGLFVGSIISRETPHV